MCIRDRVTTIVTDVTEPSTEVVTTTITDVTEPSTEVVTTIVTDVTEPSTEEVTTTETISLPYEFKIAPDNEDNVESIKFTVVSDKDDIAYNGAVQFIVNGEYSSDYDVVFSNNDSNEFEIKVPENITDPTAITSIKIVKYWQSDEKMCIRDRSIPKANLQNNPVIPAVAATPTVDKSTDFTATGFASLQRVPKPP